MHNRVESQSCRLGYINLAPSSNNNGAAANTAKTKTTALLLLLLWMNIFVLGIKGIQ